MPQVHNKALSYDTTTAFGKNSRYMASLRFTEKSLRRVNVLNSLENRLSKKKLDYYERDAQINTFKLERIKNRLVDNLQKRMAYKLVLKNHSISKAKDYQKALDQKYTLTALHSEVKNMINYMNPARVRERNARSLLHEQKNNYDNLIFQNTQKFNKLFPEKKTWMSRRVREMLEQQAAEELKEPTPLPTRERNAKKSLATLRRRIITLDDSKPSSPLKVPKTPAMSPIKTPSLSKPPSQSNSRLAKRQEISMSMMKKQKSFIEGREMTKEDIIVAMESKMNSLSVEDKTEKTITKDINNNDMTKENVKIDVKFESEEKTDEKKKSFLPPIANEAQRVNKPNQLNLQTKTPERLKLPALKMSKSVKVH